MTNRRSSVMCSSAMASPPGSPELDRCSIQGRERRVRGHTSKGIYGHPNRMLNLADDARGSSGGCHDVVERLEWTGAFGVGRRRFAVVKDFS